MRPIANNPSWRSGETGHDCVVPGEVWPLASPGVMVRVSRRELLGTAARGAVAAAASSALVSPARAGQGRGRIKIGQIGVAHAHAAGKMSALRALSDCYDVVGVAERDPQLRKRCENRDPYVGLKWMTEEQLLGARGLRAVAVETEIRDLVPTAARCVAAGVHVHLDKPAGESLPAFQELLDAARRRGLTVQMGYMFRNNPAFQLCFRAARQGWLGRIFEVHGAIGKWLPAARRKPLLPYRGGTMFELGCHLVDALVTVLGKPDAVTPYARQMRTPADHLADNQLAVFQYPKAIATIRSALVEVAGIERRQFVVCGDEGTVEIRPLEPPRLRLALLKPRGGHGTGCHEVRLSKMPGRYHDQLIELARIIRGEIENPYPPAHDLDVEEAVLRASGLLR
jgi:predicted dehydrogenase